MYVCVLISRRRFWHVCSSVLFNSLGWKIIDTNGGVSLDRLDTNSFGILEIFNRIVRSVQNAFFQAATPVLNFTFG